MRYFSGISGVLLGIIAALHLVTPTPYVWLIYAAASLLAFITLKSSTSATIARLLAVATTLLMFYFFAAFFLLVPKLPADWYQQQDGWRAVSLILAAFVLLSILDIIPLVVVVLMAVLAAIATRCAK